MAKYPNHFAGYTEEDLACPGCGAFSLRQTSIVAPDHILPWTYLVCVNESCEWVGQVYDAPRELVLQLREQARHEVGVDYGRVVGEA